MPTLTLVLLILAAIAFGIAAFSPRQPAGIQLGWVGALLITITLIAGRL